MRITVMDLCDERYADQAARELERQREEWLEQKYQDENKQMDIYEVMEKDGE